MKKGVTKKGNRKGVIKTYYWGGRNQQKGLAK